MSNCKNNIVIQFTSGNIVLVCSIKTCNSWIDGVELLQEFGPERAQLAKHMVQENDMLNYSILQKVITQAICLDMGLHLTGMFNPCGDCAMGKTKKGGISKSAVECSKILGEMPFFDIAHLPLPLLEVRSIYYWSYKEVLIMHEVFIKKMILFLIKNLKI